MQRTAPSSIPKRQEGQGGSPALLMASRIRSEQGQERAAQYLSAMEPFLAPGERTHIARTLGLPAPQPVRNSYQQPQMPNMGSPGAFGGMGAGGGMGSLGNIGNIMQIMQLVNGLQNSGSGGPAQLMQMLSGLMGGGKT